MTTAARVRPGIPDGGRFTVSAHPEADISLADLDTLDLADLDRCPVCTGSGVSASSARCPVCEGSGSLNDDAAWSRARATETACTLACGQCDEGILANLSICMACDGTGTVVDYSLAG